MADIHIEEFYKDLAKILLQLHNAFPRKTQIFVEDISGIDHPDEYGLHSPRHQSCFSAMLWLADEGYIRFDDTIRQEAIDQAVLSKKTFIRLNRLACFPAYQSPSQESSPPQAPTPPNKDSSRQQTSSPSVFSTLTSSDADQAEKKGVDKPFRGEPLTNVQLIRNTMRTATSTQLALVLEKILFGN